MQKIKSASKANQPVNKACSKTVKVIKPVKSAKPSNPQKDSKQSKPAAGHAKRIRKPLTDEQRKRKNEHDRLVRAAKRRDAARDAARKRDNRPGLVKEAADTPCSIGRVSCSTKRLKGDLPDCSNCGPECSNYAKCRKMANTDNIPRLRPVKPGYVPADAGDAGHCSCGEKDQFTPVFDFIRSSVVSDIGPNSYAIFSKRFTVGDADVEVNVSRHRSEPRRGSSEDVFSEIADEVNGILRGMGFPFGMAVVPVLASEAPAAYAGPAWVGESWGDSDGFDGEDRR